MTQSLLKSASGSELDLACSVPVELTVRQTLPWVFVLTGSPSLHLQERDGIHKLVLLVLFFFFKLGDETHS